MADASFPGEVWLRPARSGRGFGLGELAARALRVMDEDGLAGLTMRRMAAELGVATTSSLYWRVRTKAELLELALDEVVGEALDEVVGEALAAEPEARLRQVPDGTAPNGSDADARGELRRVSARLYERLVAHPWSPALLATVSGLGPNYRRLSMRLGDAVLAAGVPPELLGGALSLLLNYVIGAAVTNAGWQTTRSGRAIDDAALAEVVADALGSGGNPRIAAMLRDAAAADPDRFFHEGLDLAIAAVDAAGR